MFFLIFLCGCEFVSGDRLFVEIRAPAFRMDLDGLLWSVQRFGADSAILSLPGDDSQVRSFEIRIDNSFEENAVLWSGELSRCRGLFALLYVPALEAWAGGFCDIPAVPYSDAVIQLEWKNGTVVRFFSVLYREGYPVGMLNVDELKAGIEEATAGFCSLLDLDRLLLFASCGDFSPTAFKMRASGAWDCNSVAASLLPGIWLCGDPVLGALLVHDETVPEVDEGVLLPAGVYVFMKGSEERRRIGLQASY